MLASTGENAIGFIVSLSVLDADSSESLQALKKAESDTSRIVFFIFCTGISLDDYIWLEVMQVLCHRR